MKLILTVKQILELAEFAGIAIDNDHLPDEDDMDSEFTICEQTGSGLYSSEDNTVCECTHYVYIADYPEEGCIPLGHWEDVPFDPTKRHLGLAKKMETPA